MKKYIKMGLLSLALVFAGVMSLVAFKAEAKATNCMWVWENGAWTWQCEPETCLWQWQVDHWVWTCV
jgi:hypothetical protein